MTRHAGTNPISAVIGTNVRRHREELGVSQNGLAAAISARGASSWTAATVSALETGRRNVSLIELADLLDALNLSPRDLLSAPKDADPMLRHRIRTLTRSSPEEIIADEDGGAAMAGEVESALRAARQRRLEDNVWRAIVGGHPTQQDRLALDEAAQAAFGRDLLEERDSRVRRNPSRARVTVAKLGHATRTIISDLKPYFEKECTS